MSVPRLIPEKDVVSVNSTANFQLKNQDEVVINCAVVGGYTGHL